MVWSSAENRPWSSSTFCILDSARFSVASSSSSLHYTRMSLLLVVLNDYFEQPFKPQILVHGLASHLHLPALVVAPCGPTYRTALQTANFGYS
ncbi:hypothetical protein L6452_21203 [Arctium lappa]|uniref:Uncharacterized protein n=1 Tax=Arctium lappa TaxID=4217 RepID=A0ACB9BFF3_ARCLA|nr:hypothetical protein L6452_21203 [Arctium lappa]